MIGVELKQTIPDWSTTVDLIIGGISKENDYGTYWLHSPLDSNTNVCSVIYNPEDNSVIIDWTGGIVAIPHVYDFEESWNFDVLNTKNGEIQYIIITDDPSI